MTCEGCGAEIPKELLRETVDHLLSRGGLLETLTFHQCPACWESTDGRSRAMTWREPIPPS